MTTNESSFKNTSSHQDNSLTRGVSLRPLSRKSILGMMLLGGCNAGEVESPPLPETETDGGLGDTGGTEGTEGSNPDECWEHQAPTDAVRWQCEGLAEAEIFFTLDVEVPDVVPNHEFLQQIIDGGRLDWRDLFGPWNDETYDDPGIDAYCRPDIGGDEEEGLDETGDEPPGDDVEQAIPQAAQACAHDCADQACRAIPKTLRDLALEIPAGVPVIGPSYRDQLRDLANWVASNHVDCYNAMTAGGIDQNLGAYIVNGEWQLPNSNDWPALTDLSIDGQCKVFDWYLPEQGEPQACTGINDNNDEGPFGSSGSSFGGFDTFAPTGGGMKLDGPAIFGIHAAGTAPILGLGDACPRGECSRMDAWITEDTLELKRMVLVAPPSMTWAQNGMQLTIDGLQAIVEHPWSIPLQADGSVMRFEIPEGELEVLFAGRVHGVPVSVVVPNATPITGTVIPLFDGSHGVVIDAFAVEHRDAYGTWTMDVELGELVALDHSPRATFSVRKPGSAPWIDASASFDPDGDPLVFEWFLDGEVIGEGPAVVPELPSGLSTLAVRVTDDTGRSSWSYGLLANGG